MTLPRSLTQLGRYRIVREIGRGSMGRVYLANDPNIDRQIALKVLAPVGGLGQREELHRRFLAETRAAGKLNHTHIVTVYDAEVDAETSLPYIAMEWVEGRSLEEELRLRGPLPAAQAVELVRQVATALEHAHEHDLVHRDVKLANILLTGDGRAKLTDFGVAKLAAGGTQTLDGRVFGTPAYMSPEQILNRELDARSDLFSLGACLYELISGEKPFGGDDVTSIAYRIVNEEAPAIDSPGGDVARLEGVLARLLAKPPDERYPSCAELVTELRRVQSELRAADPRGPSAALRDAPGAPSAGASPAASRRGRQVVWGLASVLVLAVLLLTVVSGMSDEARRADATAPGAAEVPPVRLELAAGGGALEPLAVRDAAARDATLVLVHVNRIREVTMTVLVDEQIVWSDDVEGPRNPLWKTVGKDVEVSIPVPAGRRRIEVRLRGSRGRLQRSERIAGTFAGGETRRLRATLSLPARNLRLRWDE